MTQGYGVLNIPNNKGTVGHRIFQQMQAYIKCSFNYLQSFNKNNQYPSKKRGKTTSENSKKVLIICETPSSQARRVCATRGLQAPTHSQFALGGRFVGHVPGPRRAVLAIFSPGRRIAAIKLSDRHISDFIKKFSLTVLGQTHLVSFY